MARIAFVPEWLNEVITAAGHDLESVSPEMLKSSIVSKADVINYYKSQIDLLRIVLNNNTIEAHVLLERYEQLFAFDLPNSIELSVYIKDVVTKPMSCESLTMGQVKNPAEVALSIKQSVCGTVTYIIGRHVLEGQPLRSGEFRPYSESIMWNLFKKSHNGLRAETSVDDKAIAFHAYPLLTQLYVKSLCCAECR